MTNVSSEDVRHLAALGNLQLDENQARGMQVDIENILDFINQLDELDTEGVEPTYQVTGLENIWREDSVQTHAADRDALLELAPDSKNNQIKVPKVL